MESHVIFENLVFACFWASALDSDGLYLTVSNVGLDVELVP